MTPNDALDRRTVLKAAGATAIAGLLAGCSTGGSSDDGGNGDDSGSSGGNDDGSGGNGDETGSGEEVDFDSWFDGVGNYDGVVDETGSDSVTVTVGAEGNGGTYAFDPAAVRVDAGTTVAFEWVSNTHNVVVRDQPDDADWAGHETIEDDGFSFEHAFETAGTYQYVCEPHESMGMKGAIVVE